jgi:D-tyrosyl-tRNA(Tyr) deacylase
MGAVYRVLAMRAVVQRVRWAEVRVEGEVLGRIERGLLVYLGAGKGDGPEDVRALVEKVSHLRIFRGGDRPMDRSLLDVGGEALVISQFTLYGDCRRGRRPSLKEAMEPAEAADLIVSFVEGLRVQGVRTDFGRFGAMMEVESLNWGPVTILLDSKKSF